MPTIVVVPISMAMTKSGFGSVAMASTLLAVVVGVVLGVMVVATGAVVLVAVVVMLAAPCCVSESTRIA